jgi:hypothetical protein
MIIFSNTYFFPVMQIALFVLFTFAIWCDYGPLPENKSGDRADATVLRGLESMSILEKITGLVIAAIVTIINKSVFDDDAAGWQGYSAVFNLLDLVMIIYLCYFSSWVRNNIILKLLQRSRLD